MFNVKKGSGLTLQQVDKVAAVGAATTAGQIGYVSTDGTTFTPGSPATPASALYAFAIGNSTDGDVIDSGKIGLFLISSNGIIETDQAALAITIANYPVGTPIYAPVANDTTGKVTSTSTSGRLIGYVEGVRNLPAPTAALPSGYGWANVAVLSIKLGNS